MGTELDMFNKILKETMEHDGVANLREYSEKGIAPSSLTVARVLKKLEKEGDT